MKKKYLLSIQQLHEAVQNSIRIYNDYKLDRKLRPNNTYVIFGPGYDLQFQYFKTDDGCEIKTVSGSRLRKMTEEIAQGNVREFYRRIDQVVNKDIALTPEILNRDVYKSGQGLIAGVNLIRLAVAIIAIVLAIMALMR